VQCCWRTLVLISDGLYIDPQPGSLVAVLVSTLLWDRLALCFGLVRLLTIA